MYLGSSVPHITKDGLQGIQEPLRELYPDEESLASGNAGIDSWLSVWSNGILIENVDENGREVKRFYKIEALHYCAAVKYVPLISDSQRQLQENNQTDSLSANSSNNMPKFLPLDSPHARMQQQQSTNPPIFASILRRTTGVKVLECHAFICKREAAANALVRCCFHAYADTMYAKQIGADIDSISSKNNHRPLGQAQTLRRPSGDSGMRLGGERSSDVSDGMQVKDLSRSKSIAALNGETNGVYGDSSDSSNQYYRTSLLDNTESMMHRLSISEKHANNRIAEANRNGIASQLLDNNNNNLKKQQKLSKSMHQLNRDSQENFSIDNGKDYASQLGSHSTSIHNLASSKARWAPQQQGQSATDQPQDEPKFYNPYSSRVPSYPPQNLIDQQYDQQHRHNGGTLRSIKSVAANSIASTLLRSKKHAKAMSLAQMQQKQQEANLRSPMTVTGFHQPNLPGSATLAPNQTFMLPPVPPMFLPRMPIINGSQTMKLPRQHLQMAPVNFESMKPKEIKKFLKKSAKYGLDGRKLNFQPDNGLPPPLLPIRPMQQHQMPSALPPHMIPFQFPPPPTTGQNSKSGTINSQSNFSIDQGDIETHVDMGLNFNPHMGHLQPPNGEQFGDAFGLQHQPIKSILVKPNPEFLKSKAGKKWLKQQKEFKKLLPPHLDGLPIVFGPPPIDALEPATLPPNMQDCNLGASLPPPASFIHSPSVPPLGGQPNLSRSGLPVMDSNGFYSQLPMATKAGQPMYLLQNGRTSTASTLIRYSPHSMQPNDNHHQNPYSIKQGQNPYGNTYASVMQAHPHSMPPPLPNSNMLLAPNTRDSDQYVAAMTNAVDNLGQVYGGSQLDAGPMGDSRRHYMLRNNEQRRRRHMVEQSVISLGDEDEDYQDSKQVNGDIYSQDQQNSSEDDRVNGYYNQTADSSKHHMHQSQQQYSNSDQQNYEQLLPQSSAQSQNDDQSSSYSSGIYKRGHINERAFSYSIRQEHKTGQQTTAEIVDHASSRNGYINQGNHYVSHNQMS